jgi:uncharacterized protein YjbI with pentapeptide repeats
MSGNRNKKEKPLSRIDLVQQIEANNGKAQGLDLPGRIQFEDGADLSGLDLSGINLHSARLFRANFNGSVLDGAILCNANLDNATFNPLEDRAASLKAVDFMGAHLNYAQFRKADLTAAQFQGKTDSYLPAYLTDTDFRGANLFLAKSSYR